MFEAFTNFETVTHVTVTSLNILNVVNNVWSCGRTRSRVVGGQRRVSPSRVAYWYAGGTPGRIMVLSWYTSTPDMPVPSIHRTPYDKQTVVRRDLLPASTHTHKNSTTL